MKKSPTLKQSLFEISLNTDSMTIRPSADQRRCCAAYWHSPGVGPGLAPGPTLALYIPTLQAVLYSTVLYSPSPHSRL